MPYCGDRGLGQFCKTFEFPMKNKLESGSMTGFTRSRPRLLVVAAILSLTTLAFASAASASSPRSGALVVTKECSGYSGFAGSFCTITSSNLAAIEIGSRINYLQPADLFTPAGSDVVLDPPGPGNNRAFGNCSLGLGLCTFWGGTGLFTWFHANVDVSYLGGPDWAWNGTYSFSPDD
jgi:hypothetical protein